MNAYRSTRRLVLALVPALLMTGCGSSPSKAKQLTPVENPGENPTATGAAPGGGGGCSALCATGDDGMEYVVTSARRFTGLGGVSVVAVGFKMINPTSTGHDFDASGGGFSAVLASGGVVQLENELSAATAGDPSCYTNPVIHGGGSDPNRVHVDPSSTFPFPKQICMSVATSDKVVELEFADQDASGNAVVRLSTPV